jgi:hypothetical protein
MRILCGFCAKGQKFVRIRLEERFYNAFKNNEDSYAQIREVITKINTKNKFSFHCRDSMTPSTNQSNSLFRTDRGLMESAMAALHSGLDVVKVFRRATIEAGRQPGVVDIGACSHGGQDQGGAHMDTMQGHLVNAAYHRAKANFRRVSGSVHLVRC